MENQPNTPPRCHNCQQWTRTMSRKWSAHFQEDQQQPTEFGLCRSYLLNQHGTDIRVSTPNNEDLYTEDVQLFDLGDLDTAIHTRQDFGCIYHEEKRDAAES